MGHFTPGFTSSKLSALQAIQALGLTTGLQLCLDAGDDNSYSTGQVWNDRSGNAYHFNRGATSSSEASDPTFNGTAGQLSGNEFWSLDGGDYFTLGQANPTWLNNLHKNNAKLALAGWVYSANAATNCDLFGTNSANNDEVGVQLNFRSTGVLRFSATKGSAPAARTADSTNTILTGAWTFFGVTLDEAATTGTLQVGANQESFTSTYSSPSAAAASFTAQICAPGENDVVQPAGSRLATFSAWEGTIPSAANMLALYNLTRGRFGV